MSQLKTKENDESVITFLESIEHPVRRQDGLTLLEIYKEITAYPPKTWGPSIVGFNGYKRSL